MVELNEGDTNSTKSKTNERKSLIIPIISHLKDGSDMPVQADPNLFIEIFPEELPTLDSSTIIEVLKDEDAPLSIYADAALEYVRGRKEQDGAAVLSAACKMESQCSSKDIRVRVLASAGIAHLTQANRLGGGDTLELNGKTAQQQAAADQNEELRSVSEELFNKATTFDQFFPMTWVGKGILNLNIGKIKAARFFFDTTIRQCGQVLPALLGEAAVNFIDGNYKEAQDLYAKVMTLYPEESGASVRVGFGLCCYKLNQVDRAKASFKRAYQIDQQNVEAMVGCAVLEIASVDETAKDFLLKTENAMKLISMASYIDHSNAMVQNHLANHYFHKWSQVHGTVSIRKGQKGVHMSQPIPLENGERVRIGQNFESAVVKDDDDMMIDESLFKIKDPWTKNSQTGLKLWKKDYDRVFSLAKDAYNSTTVQEIQAESLFLLARVYHVREDYPNAHKFYDKACKLAPDLSPARFGLAQVLIWQEKYGDAAAHLKLLLLKSPTATDALAALGLLEIKENRKEALSNLKKAVDLDPLNTELILLEAFALQQEDADYSHALESYYRAVTLMQKQGKDISHEVWTNMGVLCQETKQYKKALENYAKALDVLDDGLESNIAGKENDLNTEIESECLIKFKQNSFFWKYIETNLRTTVDTETTILSINVDEKSERSSDLERLREGDHIKLGDKFETEIISIDLDTKEVTIKDKYVFVDENTNPVFLFVKRSNNRLKKPSVITIAFNLARLHESAGEMIPSIELHKAIVKQHPSYVNSYLRLACIARDCSSILNCSQWLSAACKVAPGNTEVLSLVGNLHLSLCDWEPAQKVFNELVGRAEESKDESVKAYSQLSLGNIYFNNLNTPKKYAKHLFYAAKFYKQILSKDNANAYAANGLGTILAEKGELLKAKEVFNRVREISGGTIPDTLLNLGHIYLAQKKHPEAIQMYQKYMTTITATGAPVTSKSQEDNEVEILMYIAFAYFDWAKQTELFNDIKAADADGRYKHCIEYIDMAMKKSKKENVILRYNWCRAKLQAANCVLQKLQRNIRRTAQEVRDALAGLEESLPVVQKLLQWKSEKKRIPIATSTLNDFISHCKANIVSAKSHLSEELKKENEARELLELQRREVEQHQRDREREQSMKEALAKMEEEKRERRAQEKMNRISHLVNAWDRQKEEAMLMEKEKNAKKESKKKGLKGPNVPSAVDEAGVFDNDVPQDNKNLFDDSDDNDSIDGEETTKKTKKAKKATPTSNELFGDDSDDSDDENELALSSEKTSENNNNDDNNADPSPAKKAAHSSKDLFGDSESSGGESDEELVPQTSEKRSNVDVENTDNPSNKKRRVIGGDDEDE